MKNWMSKLPDDKKIILTNIPGSHDSTAYNMHYFGSVFAKCQDLDILEQLNIGVRRFDIRVANGQSNYICCGLSQLEADNFLDLICCHGICNCYYDENNTKKVITYKKVLLTFKTFLEENPSETIILSTDSGRGDKFNNLRRANEIFENLMDGVSIDYYKNLTIGSARGKVINTNHITNKTDLDGNLIYNVEIEGGTGLEEIHRKFVIEFVYASFKVSGSLKVDEVKEFLETNEMTFEEAEKEFEKNSKKFPFKYSISCTGEYESIVPLPKTQADIVNPFILNYNLKNGNYYGWINIDFVDLNIAKKIIDTNF